MIREYIDAAMRRAKYEVMEDGEGFYGEVPDLQGVWATGQDLEGCRDDLESAIEDWVLFSIANGFTVPTMGEAALQVPDRIGS